MTILYYSWYLKKWILNISMIRTGPNELETPRPTVAMFRGWSSHEYWRNDHWPYVATQISIFLKTFLGFLMGFPPTSPKWLAILKDPKPIKPHWLHCWATRIWRFDFVLPPQHLNEPGQMCVFRGNGVYQSIHSCWYHGDILGIWWEYIYIWHNWI